MTDPTRPVDSLLARFLSGECSDAERLTVEHWLDADPGHGDELARLAQAWARPMETMRASAPPDVDAFWTRVRSRIEEPARAELRLVLPGRPRWVRLARVAAVIALLIGAGLAGAVLVDRSAGKPATPTYSVVSTTRGQRLSIRLSDGTLVTLAPGTILRTPSTYGTRDRALELEGEAAFTVTHDSTRPFSVRTSHAVARDLGTHFLVRAYGGERATDIVVAEGRVAVGREASSATGSLSRDSLVITKGDRVRVDPARGLSVERDVVLDRYFGWTEGKLVFRRTPLSEAIVQLERWYDIDIRLGSPSLGEQGLTATFNEGEPVAQVLQVITAVLQLDVAPTGARSYTLRARR